MKLYANLIPAIAYALTTMLSNMAGVTSVVENHPQKQQIVSLPVTSHELNSQKSCVLVTKNGQLIRDSFFEFFPGPLNTSGCSTVIYQIFTGTPGLFEIAPFRMRFQPHDAD